MWWLYRAIERLFNKRDSMILEISYWRCFCTTPWESPPLRHGPPSETIPAHPIRHYPWNLHRRQLYPAVVTLSHYTPFSLPITIPTFRDCPSSSYQHGPRLEVAAPPHHFRSQQPTYCIYRSQPETEMSSTVGDGDVLYGRRRRCLVWPETEMSRMAGDDCWLWYGLMAFSRTCTLIYIGLVALIDRIHNQASLSSLFQHNDSAVIPSSSLQFGSTSSRSSSNPTTTF